MAVTLSPQDRADISSARTAGVLADLAPEKFDFHAGVIAILCPDGDQTEKRTHLEALVASQNGDKRVHLITQHGAALSLSASSPLSNPSLFLPDLLDDVARNRSRLFKVVAFLLRPLVWLMGWMGRRNIQILANLWAAIRMKQIKTIVLYIHAPCGAADHCGVSFRDELLHLIKAKRRIEWWLGYMGIKVACFCHVDYGAGKKKTYFIKTRSTEDWLGDPLRCSEGANGVNGVSRPDATVNSTADSNM